MRKRTTDYGKAEVVVQLSPNREAEAAPKVEWFKIY